MVRVIYTNEHGVKYIADLIKMNKDQNSFNYECYDILVDMVIMDDGIYNITPFNVYHVPQEQLSYEGLER